MTKKVYDPGEMFHESYYSGESPYNWERFSQAVKDTWAERERHLFSKMSVLMHNDEQTDDSSGLPASLLSQ